MMSVALHPVDTWFFRDARPYNQHEPWQTDVVSLFPPHPFTVSGALRSLLARQAGWDGRTRWPEEIAKVLGRTVEETGEARFLGGALARNGETFYPPPLSLLGLASQDEAGLERFEPRAHLLPGPTCQSDLGIARLPVAPDATPELRGPAGFWISAHGLTQVLAGRLPAPGDFVSQGDLFELEPRVGIVRDQERRTTCSQEGSALYSPMHVRLARNVALLTGWSGVPEEWTPAAGQPFPFGGEGRQAILEPTPMQQPDPPPGGLGPLVALVLVTPTLLPLPPWPGDDLAGCEGVRIISGCLGPAEKIGGYDSLKRRPVPPQACVPAGSVLFCEASEPALARLKEGISGESPRVSIGLYTGHGFGQAFLGLWNDEMKEQA
ncbi:MAG: type III-B CRISPR module-associated Cmr3 family protein [Planctomycetota bacterium]